MRRIMALALLTATIAGCSSSGSDAAETTAATTTTESASPLMLYLDLAVSAGDSSGIYTEDGDGTACGPIDMFTGPGDTYGFIKPGSQVEVTDGSGTTLAVGKIGTSVTKDQENAGTDRHQFTCEFDVDLGKVERAAFYKVTVDGHEVGTAPSSERKDGALHVDMISS